MGWGLPFLNFHELSTLLVVQNFKITFNCVGTTICTPWKMSSLEKGYVKNAFNSNFETWEKIFKKYVYQHDPIAILASHQVKKVLREKILFFSLRIQILAILF